MKYRFTGVYQQVDRKGKPWQAVASYNDANGKRKQKWHSCKGAKGKREAERMGEEWVNELNQLAEEEVIAPEDTVEEVITAFLEEQVKKHRIEESTYNWQTQQAKAYIFPYIGSLSFYSLERMEIEKWLTDLWAKGYAQNTVKGAFLVLNKTFANAVRIEAIDKNPCSLVNTPKAKHRKSYMTDAQMNNFLASVWLEFDDEEHRHLLIACLLAYYCGLRRGELCSLRWRNINFNQGTLTVDSAVGIRQGGQYLKDPKNFSSYRQFPIPEQMLKVLKDRYDEIKPAPNHFVCGRGEAHLGLTQFNIHFHAFAKKYNLTDAYGTLLTPHLLRHNFGYSAVRSGSDIGALSRILGHANQSITLNVYSDTSPEAVKVGMDKIANFFKERDLDE
jgi:integrase